MSLSSVLKIFDYVVYFTIIAIGLASIGIATLSVAAIIFTDYITTPRKKYDTR